MPSSTRTPVDASTPGAAVTTISGTDLTVERTFRLTTSLPGHRDMLFTCAIADLPNEVRRAFDPAGTGTEVQISADGTTATVFSPDGTPGFVFTVTTDDTPAEVDPRQAAFALVVAGVAAGLPIPRDTSVGADSSINHGNLVLHMGDDSPEGVRRWASYLSLPEPTNTTVFASGGKHIQTFEAETWNYSATSRRVTVKTYVPHVCDPVNMVELRMSDCRSGCKVMSCPACKQESIVHSATYGCTSTVAVEVVA